jgi:hypothetical protein
MNNRHDTIFEWFDRLAFLLALVVVPLLIVAYFLLPSVSWIPPQALELAHGLIVNFVATLVTAIVFYLLLRTPSRMRARQAEARLVKKVADALMERLSDLPDRIAHTSETVDATDRIIKNRIKPFFDRFLPGHPQHGFYELQWKYLLRGLGHVQDEHTLIVDYTAAHTLWRDALVESDSWDAMSYALDLWENAARDISRAHQEAHVKLGGAIRRVFVLDSTDDLPNVLAIMREQAAFVPEVCLRWIERAELEAKARDQLDISELELLDFSIVDTSSYVLWFRLSEQTRQPQDAVLTIDPAILRRGRQVFELAFTFGHRLADL